MLLKMFCSWPFRKIMATMTAMAMTAMMSAYSTSPWPSSLRMNSSTRDHLLSSALNAHFSAVRARFDRAPRTVYRASEPADPRAAGPLADGPLLKGLSAHFWTVHVEPQEHVSSQLAMFALREVVSDVAEDVLDLPLQEDHRDDDRDGDDGDDECVFHQSLAFVVANEFEHRAHLLPNTLNGHFSVMLWPLRRSGRPAGPNIGPIPNGNRGGLSRSRRGGALPTASLARNGAIWPLREAVLRP